MKLDLYLRPVIIGDANHLLEWRNDVATRQAPLSAERVEVADHLKWLRASICSEKRRLCIAELNHRAVGTIRADLGAEGWSLSWTVAPKSRGKGIGQKMLDAFIKDFNQPLLAQIKAANIASQKITERAGFLLEKENNGVLYYRREAKV